MAKRDLRLIPGKVPLAYLGVNPASPPNVEVHDRAPTTDDGKNFELGDMWLDTSTTPRDVYMLVSLESGSATWLLISSSFDGTVIDHGVMVGDGTNSIKSIPVGNTGELLTGVTGSDPVFDSSSDGDFSFFRNDAGSRELTIASLDNTSSSSHAALLLSTGGASGGDPEILFTPDVGSNYWSLGVDNDDSDKFKISKNLGLGFSNAVSIDSSRNVEIPVSLTLSSESAGVVQSDGTGLLSSSVGTDGQVLISDTGGVPAWANLTAGTNITVTDAANSITIETTGAVANSYDADVGSAIPAANTITFTGGNNISTNGAAAEITIDIDGTTEYALQVGDGLGGLDSLGLGTADQILLSGGAGADPLWSTATYPATTTQGDVLYSSADNTLSSLAKDATATRYLANTGASNNPAWDQVNLTNGVTGTLPVTNGGTGAATLTDHGALVGSGTSAITALAVGTDGQVLIGSTGDDPTFSSITSSGSTIAFTPGAGTLNLETGSAVCTSAGSDSGTATPSSGVLTFSGGTNVTTSATGSTVTINASGGGGATSSFRAYLSTSQLNVTGDGTIYTLICDTEDFDVGSDYNNATGVFTAPQDGKYVFVGAIRGNNDANSDSLEIDIYINSNDTIIYETDLSSFVDAGGSYCLPFTHYVDLTASDTVAMRIVASNGTSDINDIIGPSDYATYFSGWLVF